MLVAEIAGNLRIHHLRAIDAQRPRVIVGGTVGWREPAAIHCGDKLRNETKRANRLGHVPAPFRVALKVNDKNWQFRHQFPPGQRRVRKKRYTSPTKLSDLFSGFTYIA